MPKEKESEFSTAGWDAISAALSARYPGQEEPIHYAPLVSWQLGGNDPLDGISIYDGGDYYHFVTYGFSELYEKEAEDAAYSGFGFELTLKLKKASIGADEELELRNLCGVLQTLGRMSFEEGDVFRPLEYIYTGQTSGLDAAGTSPITGFVTCLDELGEIDTPNGKVQFVQLVGMTDAELRAAMDKRSTVEELLLKLGDTLTDYKRPSLC